MAEPFYVPFEPGINMQKVWTPRVVVATLVDEVPDIGAIDTAAADAWFDRPAIENLSAVRTRTPADPPTRVAVMCDDRYLLVAFECMEPAMANVHRLVPADAKDGKVDLVDGALPRTMAYDEHVSLQLDCAHDKTAYFQLSVSINGAHSATRRQARMSWTALPAETYLDNGELQWDSVVCERGDRWRAAIGVDLASVGIEPGQPTVGVNLVRARNVDWMRYDSWVDVVHTDNVPGVALGDLYLRPAGATVRRVDFGNFETGSNRVTVTVAGEGRARLSVRVADGGDEAPGETHSADAAPAGGEADLAADFELPFDRTEHAVTLEVVDADSGAPAYRASWPLSNHANINVSQPYVSSRSGAADPSPDEADFHEKKIRRLISRLPKFCRRTTAQGAPSDFTLAAEDGSVAFNLMEAGALKRIADWVCTLFASDSDRLAAVALLTNDNWITTHAAVRVKMHWQLTPLSLLRLGTGHCYSRAVVGAGIAGELPDPATGANHRAWPTLVLGHVITAVERPGGWTYIDPSFGHFFYNADNTDLATAAELAADHSLVTRVVKGAARLRNYASTAGHVRLETGTIVWPAGAPAR